MSESARRSTSQPDFAVYARPSANSRATLVHSGPSAACTGALAGVRVLMSSAVTTANAKVAASRPKTAPAPPKANATPASAGPAIRARFPETLIQALAARNRPVSTTSRRIAA